MNHPYQRKNRIVVTTDMMDGGGGGDVDGCNNEMNKTSSTTKTATTSSSSSTSTLKKNWYQKKRTKQQQQIILFVVTICGILSILLFSIILYIVLGIGVLPNKRPKHQIRELLSNQHEKLLYLHEQQERQEQEQEEEENNYIYDLYSINDKNNNNNNNNIINRKDISNVNKTITVIIMNHARPYMLQKSILLSTLESHPSIGQIILCHSNPETIFTYESASTVLLKKKPTTTATTTTAATASTTPKSKSKVLNINAIDMNQKIGLALRFYYCSFTGAPHQQSTESTTSTTDNTTSINSTDDNSNDNKNNNNNNNNNNIPLRPDDWILHIDDDMELDYEAIDTLISYMSENPKRLVGHYGRSYNYYKVPFRHGYDYATKLFGPVEVVLTKVLLMERIVCQQFIDNMHVVEDYINNNTTTTTKYKYSPRRRHSSSGSSSSSSMPLWNGEDVFVNIVANKYYNVSKYGPYNNYAIEELTVWENTNETLRGSLGTDISGNMERHDLYTVGFFDWFHSILHGIHHAYYRGKLWYIAKERLYGTTTTTGSTGSSTNVRDPIESSSPQELNNSRNHHSMEIKKRRKIVGHAIK